MRIKKGKCRTILMLVCMEIGAESVGRGLELEFSQVVLGFRGGSHDKESAYNVGDLGLIGVRKIPWRREWQATPVFFPGEFDGQRSLAGYSPWGCKEPDTTEPLTLYFQGCIDSVKPVCVCARLCRCDPKDCSPAGSSVRGISQAGILEWVAISFSRGSS